MIDISSLRERENVNTFTVSDLNNYIKNIFETNRTLSSVTVRGEISNFTNHRSGHLYFSLKDEDGQIKAVMFRSRAQTLKFMPESGMKVIVHGSVTVYPRDGSYQLYVSSMQPDGIGALYLAYEQLKQKLTDEGLFDEEHKLPLPAYPARVGVITSPTGAAVRDIINVTGRRYPCADLYIYPALVQGVGAEQSLIKALDYLDSAELCDVIIIGRGGGSIEDLWAFNSEALARRIYSAYTPIISAVGHETDFTICDFVADLRAPTPSAAAEIAVPDKRDLLLRIDSFNERLINGLKRKVERSIEKVRLLDEKIDKKILLDKIKRLRENVNNYTERSLSYTNNKIMIARDNLAKNAGKADALSPLATLSRGYSIAKHSSGKIIKRTDELKPGVNFELILSDGKVEGCVTKID